MRKLTYLLDLVLYSLLYAAVLGGVFWITQNIFSIPQAPWAVWCYAIVIAIFTSTCTVLWLSMLNTAGETYRHACNTAWREKRFKELKQQATKEAWERMLP